MGLVLLALGCVPANAQTQVQNAAQVTLPAGVGDTDPGNNSDSVTVDVYAVALAKSASPASGTAVAVGDTIDYTITATVSGGATTSTPVVVTDTLDPGLQPVAPLPAGCILGGSTLTCTIPAGTSGTYTVDYSATVLASAGTSVGNSVAGGDDCSADCSTTHPILRGVTLTKSWTDGAAGDSVALAISGPGVAGAVDGSSAASGATTPATAAAAAGSTVTIAEAFTPSGSAANYTTALSCVRDAGGGAVPVSGSGLSGTFTMPDDSGVSCTIANTRIAATLRLDKTWVNARDGETATVSTDGFDNEASSGLSISTGDNTTRGTAVTVFAGETGTISEVLSNAGDYDATLDCTGNSVALAGNSLTIGPADTAIVCTQTNARRSASLILEKQWVAAAVGEEVQISASGSLTGAITLDSVADTASEVDAAAPQPVYAGETITLSEVFAVAGNDANYATTLSCSSNVTPLAGSVLTVSPSDTTITCRYVNTRRQTTLRLSKAWGTGSRVGDQAQFAATVGLQNNTNAFASTATVGAGSTTVTVYAGETATLPAETMSGAALADYTVDLACSGGDLSGSDGKAANTLAVLPSDQGVPIQCVYTNQRRATTLQLQKTWLNGLPGDTVSLVASGLGSFVATAAGGASETDTGPVWTIYSGDVITIDESFSTITSDLYETTLSCTNTSGLAWNPSDSTQGVLTVGPSDGPVVCTFVNDRKSAQLVVRKVWGGPSPGATVSIPATTGFTNNAPAFTSDFPTTTTVGPVEVFAFESGFLGAENFTSGSAGDFTRTLSCDGTDTNLSNGLTIPIADAGKTITCTYSNVFVPRSSIDVEKTTPTTSVTAVGEVISYTITITNTGNVPLANVDADDSLTALACTPALPVATLAPGATVDCTASYAVQQADIDRNGSGDGVNDDYISNDVTASGTDPDGATLTDSDGVDVRLPDQRYQVDFTKSGALADSNGSGAGSVGEQVEYTFTLTNNGNSTLQSVDIDDPLLPGLQCGPVPPIPPGTTVTFGTSPPAQVPCTGNVLTIPQGVIDSNGDGNGSLDNIATGTGTWADGQSSSGGASSSTPLDPPVPRINIDKTASPDRVSQADDVVTYTFVVSNPGNVTISGIEVTDPLAGLSAITCPGGMPFTLAPGASVTCTATYTVTQDDIDGRPSIDNTATANGDDPSGNPVTDADSATVIINTGPASARLVKTGDRTFVSAVGETVTYTFVVENPSDVTLTDITLADSLLAGLSCDTIPSLAPDQSATFTCTGNTYTVQQSDIDEQGKPTDSGHIVNTATATWEYQIGGTPGVGTSSDSWDVELPQRAPGIFLTKNSDVASVSGPGPITYSFQVRNTGNTTLTAVTISDTLLPDLECPEIASLAPGSTVTVPGCTGNTYPVTQHDIDVGSEDFEPGDGQIDNRATATGTVAGTTGTVSNTDLNEVNLPVRTPRIELLKRADTTRVTTPVEITYSFVASNTGNVTLNDVAVTDTDIGLVCPTTTLAPGASAIFGGPGSDVVCTNYTRTVTQADIDTRDDIQNAALVSGTTVPGAVLTATSTLSIPVTKNRSLAFAKTADVATVSMPGDPIVYTLTGTNNGNLTIENVRIIDPMLPSLDCDPATPIATLAPGEGFTCTGTYLVTQSDFDTGGGGDQEVENTAAVLYTGGQTSDDAVVGLPVPAQSLTVEKVPSAPSIDQGRDPTVVDAGDYIAYTFTVTNTGNQTLSLLGINDARLDATAICDRTTLAATGPTSTATCTGQHTLSQAEMDAGVVINTATASATPPNSARVTSPPDTVTVNLDAVPVIELDKTAAAPTVAQGALPAVTDAGDTIAYSFVVTNTGNVTLEDIAVNDPQLSPNQVNCPPGQLAPGASMTCDSRTRVITQADMDAGRITNTATASGTSPGGTTVTDDDSTDEPLTKAPSMTLVKTVAPAVVSTLGQVATYSFQVTNTGNVTLDTLSVSEDVFSGTGTRPVADCPVTTLAPGAATTCTATYAVTQADLDAGEITNTATATARDPEDASVSSDPDDAVVTVDKAAALTLAKSASPATVTAVGQTVTYTFEVTNSGNLTVSGLAIDEDTFTGTGTLSAIVCQATTLAPLASTSCSATYEVTQADLDAGAIDNSATAIAEDPDGGDVASPQADAVVTVTQNAELTLVKTASPLVVTAVGDTVTYTFEVTNGGNVTIDNLAIDETAFSGTGTALVISCLVTELAPTESTSCTGTYAVTQADLDAGQVTNTATANGTDPGNAPVVSPQADAVVTVTQNAELTLVKTASPLVVTAVGDTVTYTFEVTNGGNVTIDNLAIDETAFSGTGTAPAAPTCAATTLAPGDTTTCSTGYTIVQADLDAGQVTNTATANGTDPGNAPVVSPQADAVVTVTQNAELTLVKTASPLVVTAVGDTVTYTFEVSNDGNVTIDNLTIDETAFSGTGTAPATPTCAATTLAPGDATTCTTSYTIVQADLDAGQVTNTATANGTDPGNAPVVSPQADAVVTVTQNAELTLVKTASPLVVTAVGDTVTYTFEVTNDGNVTIDNLTIDETAFSGTGTALVISCPVTELAPTESTSCTGTYAVTQADLDAGQVTNTATANGTDPGNGPVVSPQADAVVTATQTPGLLLDKSTTATGYDSVGDLLPYSYLVTNSGNVTITGAITVDDDRIVAPNSVNCPALPAGGLAPGAAITCTATHIVTQADLDAGSVTNIATATDGSIVTLPDSVTVDGTQTALLTLVKSASPTTVAAAGDTVTYTFEVTNGGNVTIDNLVIDETAFSGVGIAPALPTCVATTLAPGDATTCTTSYTIVQGDLDAGQVTNTATANGIDPGAAPVVSGPSSAVVTATQTPGLTLDKSTTATGYDSVGDLLPYSYLVTNSGNVTITGAITVDDDRIVAPNSVNCPALPAGGLAPGAAITCTAMHIVTQADLDAGSVTNIATATDGTNVSPPDSETVDGTQIPTIVLAKTASLADSNGDGVLGDAGDTITYAFSVENTGNVVLAPVIVTDPLLPDLSCAIATLSPGDTAACVASGDTYVITTADEVAGSVDNTALATGDAPGTAPDATDDDTASTPTLPTPAATTVVKSASPASGTEIAPGDTLTYTVTVTVADASLHEPVTLTDTLGTGLTFGAVTSAGAFTCNAANPLVCTLPAGTAPGSYAVVYTATVDADASGTVGNNVVADKPAGIDPDPVCTTCDTDHPVVPSTSTVSKSSTPASNVPVNPGTTIAFTLTTVVTGSVTTEPVTLVDTLGPGLTFVTVTDPGAYACSGTLTCVLPAGTLPGSYNLVYTATVDMDAAGVLTNTVVPSNPDGGDPEPVCTACDTVHPVSRPAVELEKEVTANDDADGNGEVSVGDTLTYTVTATNTGNVPLANVTIVDELVTPDSVTCALVQPGGQCALVATYVVTQADADAGQVLNTATVQTEAPPDVPPLPPQACPTGSTDPACTTDNVTPVVQRPAIATTKTAVLSVDSATPGKGNIGDVVTYSVNATNTGNVTLTGVTVNDTFQGGAPVALSCAPTTLAPGQTATCASYDHTITEAEVHSDEGLLVNTVLAAGDAGLASGTIQVTANAAAQVEVQNEPAQLYLTKVASVRQVNIGDLVRYTLTLENTGEIDLVDGYLIDTPAPGFTYVEGSVQGGDDDNFVTASGASPLRISDIDIVAGNTATITYLMRVGAGVRPGVQINRAVAFDPAYDGPASNVATAEVVLGSDPLLDESLISGTVFNDRDSDAWQDSAALTGVRVQGGFAPGAYIAGSTTVDRGEGPEAEADASAPLLHGIAVGRIAGRQSQADPASAHEVVIRQRLRELDFTGDFVLTSEQGATVRMAADGSTTVEAKGDAAKGLTAAAPTVQRQVAQAGDGYQVDYVVRNEGIDERGIPGVRIASVEGLLVETDQYGRYHLVGIDAGQAARGRNFILKVDTATLPKGAELTTENPKVRRITGGVPTRFDFGVRLPEQVIEGRRQVEMTLGTVVFSPGSAEVQARYLPVVDSMVEQIRRNGAGEVVISADGETEALAFARASAVRALLDERLDPALRPQVVLSVRADPDDPASLLAGIGEGGPVLGTLLFDTDKATIQPRFDGLLDQVAQMLAASGGGSVAIIGHADRRGSREYNAALGLRRARAVYDALAPRLPPEVRARLTVQVDPDPDAPLAVPPPQEGQP